MTLHYMSEYERRHAVVLRLIGALAGVGDDEGRRQPTLVPESGRNVACIPLDDHREAPVKHPRSGVRTTAAPT